MKRYLAVLGFALLGTTQANAQLITAGPEIGIQLSNIRVQDDGAKSKGQLRSGIRAGLLTDIKITDDLSFQPAVYYSKKGYELERTSTVNIGGAPYDEIYNRYVTINYLELPLNMQYKFSIGTGYVFVGAGPYVAAALSGKVLNQTTRMSTDSQSMGAEVETVRGDLKIGSGVNDQIKYIDAGLNANLGYLWDSGFLVRGSTAIGLKNLAPVGDDDNSIRNFSFSLTLGYLISYE